MTSISPERVRALRMAALLIAPRPSSAPAPSTVDGIVTHLGAMQAQDNASGLWSLGLRLGGATQAEVVAALERREALRTWPMRGTVHLVPARDAHWMLDVIGSNLTEVNVTSPTCFVEITEQTGFDVAGLLADALTRAVVGK